jgi:hypothetical protein
VADMCDSSRASVQAATVMSMPFVRKICDSSSIAGGVASASVQLE